MFNKEFIGPYYVFNLELNDFYKLNEYISHLKNEDFIENRIKFTDSITNEYFEDYRLCEIHHPQNSSVVYDVGKKLFQSTNKKFYQYDLKNIFEFQLIRYYEGGNYNWHCDYGISPRRGVVRKLSMSVQLSKPSNYEGGELQIVDYCNRTITIPNELGTVVIFDSKLPHKVHPVTFGERISLVGWANGPKLR